jgi:penicillin-binding protein 1A
VTEVTDSTGNVIYRRLGSGPSLRIDSTLVANMNRMLSAVVQYGTGRAANTGRPVAGKTGTTDDFRDAWFIGYSSNHIAGVWVGNDDHSPMKRVTGGGLPAQIWHDIMIAADGNQPARPLVAQPQQEQQQRSSAPVQSFLDNLFHSVFGGSTSSSSSSNAGSRPSGGARSSRPPIEERNTWRD